MDISLVRHLKTTNPNHLKLGSADGNFHVVVTKIESEDASFNAFYRDNSVPYRVKQLSGDNRDLTEAEFQASNRLCHDVLLKSINKNLAKVPEYKQVANIIKVHAGNKSSSYRLLMAVKLFNSSDRQEMYYHLSHMLNTTDSVIDAIIASFHARYPETRFLKYN